MARWRNRDATRASESTLRSWLEKLQDPNSPMEVVTDCAAALGHSGARRYVRPLIRIARSNADWPVRMWALHALSWLADSRAVPATLYIAGRVDIEPEWTRDYAVLILRLGIRKRFVQAAVARYVNDPAPRVRYAAMGAIDALRRPLPLPSLLQVALEQAAREDAGFMEDGDITRFAEDLLLFGHKDR